MWWAFYYDGCIANGIEPPKVIEFVQEKKPPYVVQPFVIDHETLDEGRVAYRDALVRIAECRSMGRWPGYADGTVRFQLPRYALSDPETDALDGLDLDDVREES